ncbi:pleckstrin homology domain-containing family G member 4B-like isoform X2 [Erpetoichthys calabaricus]|nr:pleckstrin homology domain-containing family G member 4B-like isoform X2 [Erpetoichthys calabaricus]
MNQRIRARSCDTYLSIKDSESLDTCIQSTLSALYPPFNATAATVLWQLFSVVEKVYRGDGLRCLIDFLVPAKRILQSIQEETCAKFKGFIFYHEGWPLCIHEKIIVQLASLHKVRLKPGDFYIQIVPLGKQSAKLVLKCLSRSGEGIQEILVPESMYGSIFTTEFLQNVTEETNCCPLLNCLLTTGTVVYRTPWRNIVNPVFVTSPDSMLPIFNGNAGHDQNRNSNVPSDNVTDTLESHSSQDSFTSGDTDSTVIEVAPHDNQGNNSSNEVFSQQDTTLVKENEVGSSDNQDMRFSNSKKTDGLLLDNEESKDVDMEDRGLALKADTRSASRVLSFNTTDLSDPGPRRRPLRDSTYFETRRLFRKSYMEALQNPMHLGSSSEESINEETVQQKDNCLDVSHTSSDDKDNQRESIPCQTDSVRSREVSRPHNPPGPALIEDNRLNQRRSKSLDRTPQSTESKTHRTRSSSGGPASRSSKKTLNGYTQRVGKLDFEESDKGSQCTKADSGIPQHCTHEEEIRRSSEGHESGQLVFSRAPKCENLFLQATTSEPTAGLPGHASEVNQDLLLSEAVILPGSRDRTGHAVIQVDTRNNIWGNEKCTAKELCHLMVYFYSILRKEKQELGLTVVVDGRRYQSLSVVIDALMEVQIIFPNSIHSVLMLVDKESPFKCERDTAIQYEVLMSLKALHKHVDLSQLTQAFEGSFPYDHNQWIQFRKKLEPFSRSCNNAIASLQSSIATLNASCTLNTVQEVVNLTEKQKSLMKFVLDDTSLVRLRLEGGTILARLKKEEFCDTEDYRDSIEMVTALYNQVDEEVHKLVMLSNKSLQHLENLLALRKFEEGCNHIKLWFIAENEKHFTPVDNLTISLDVLKQMQQRFTVFEEESSKRHKQGLQLIKDSKNISSCPLVEATHLDEKVQNFKQFLNIALIRAEKRKSELNILVNLYEFYDTANRWIEHCQDYLTQMSAEKDSTMPSLTALRTLHSFHREAAKFSPENFHKLNEMVLNLNSTKEMKQWNSHWMKCQTVRQELEEILSRSSELPKGYSIDGSSEKTCGDFNHVDMTQMHGQNVDNNNSAEIQTTCQMDESDVNRNSQSSLLFPDPERYIKSASVFDDTDSDCTVDSFSVSCQSEPLCSPVSRQRKHPLKKIMKKTLSYDLSQRDTSHGEISPLGFTGVYIKGLEIGNNISGDKKTHRAGVNSPHLSRSRSLSSPPSVHCRHADDNKPNSNRLQHIMDEMIMTEREYVRSLGYIIENYYPEMERMDLPQDLRGKRNIIFGNLEKLYDFHSQYFLQELEQSAECPLLASSCFLRHEEQFGMYALYSKNKPQSDALLASHINGFFRNKQLELGDKMDLASYLLKPIQRMSKYALLLKDMIKECSKSQEQELDDLRAAEEMVKFQLRHGNDLLAMDAIRGCDVNLKEQGQLRCQDEFIVWCGRKKYLRHVFLFEDLILFSKTKKIDGGYDIYIYKQSFKTAEIGMTENVGDSGLRFEIWFRRRKSQDTFILQASSGEVKAAWTTIIGKILWRQALRNRELRMQEMVSMGIGNKPFMDIKPSEAAISDRAIDYIMKGTESRSRASIAVSSFDHSTPFKRPHSTISNSSTSSSSSQSSSSILGSLNLHLYHTPSYAASNCTSYPHWSYDIGTCIEEDELEQETGSQPSMITESSETSSQGTSAESMSGFSSVSHSCHSQLPIESFTDEDGSFFASSSPSQSTSPQLYKKGADLKQPSNQYITAL